MYIVLAWPVYIAFVTIVVTGSSNAVNLADGLDGLAIGLSIPPAIAGASIEGLDPALGNTITTFAIIFGIAGAIPDPKIDIYSETTVIATNNDWSDPAVAATHSDEWDYYPREWVSPYVERRRKVGLDLYGLLGIGKADKARMHEQHGRNYAFFDAPVGLIFTIDRVMRQGSWLDYGMFLENIMIAARARGLDTCPQAAFTQFHRVEIARLLVTHRLPAIFAVREMVEAGGLMPWLKLRLQKERV